MEDLMNVRGLCPDWGQTPSPGLPVKPVKSVCSKLGPAQGPPCGKCPWELCSRGTCSPLLPCANWALSLPDSTAQCMWRVEPTPYSLFLQETLSKHLWLPSLRDFQQRPMEHRAKRRRRLGKAWKQKLPDGAQRGQEWSCCATGAYLSMGGGGAKCPHGSVNVSMAHSSLCRQHAWAKHCPFPRPLPVGRFLDGQPVGVGWGGVLDPSLWPEGWRSVTPHPMPPHPSLVQPPLSSRFPEHLLPVTTRLLRLGVSNQIYEFLPPCPSDVPPPPSPPQPCGLSCHHPSFSTSPPPARLFSI